MKSPIWAENDDQSGYESRLKRKFGMPVADSPPFFRSLLVLQAQINGHELPALAWSPWEIDITEVIHAGANELTLTRVNSLRNLLGPHHHCDGELTRVSPDSFTGRATWTSARRGDDEWYDVRRVREPLIWRDDYHVIAFGLAGAVTIVEK